MNVDRLKRFAVPAVLCLVLLAMLAMHIRMNSNELAAKASLTMIDAGLKTYSSWCGELPRTLPDLAENDRCGTQGFISHELVSGHDNGYSIVYEVRDANGHGKLDGYNILAVPTIRWITGRHTYYIDSTGMRGIE